VIEVGRETRYDLYDLFLEAPPTLVPRHRRREVSERMDFEGQILMPLDETLSRRLRTRWSSATASRRSRSRSCMPTATRRMNGARPRSFAAPIRIFPLTLSSEVAPEIREYERTSTACANAYVQPLMRRYLNRLETRLTEIGFAGRLYVMLSGGGIAAVQEAKDFPIRMIESGPAAGAMAASFLARLAGLDRVVSFDMGGTTAKMCLVENGAPDHKFDFEAGRVRRFVRAPACR